MEGSAALADVEQHGMKIDVDYLDRAILWTGEKIRELENALREDEIFKTWRKIYGSDSDLGKRDQLSDIIFGQLGHKPVLFTKTGKPKTDEEAFEHLDIPFVKKWLDHEKLKRLRTTDLIGTRRQTDRFGFLHPFFHLHFATTYRSSSSDPNFQNKPNRDQRLAKLIRQAFVPRSDEYCLIEADYGALEFRGAACFWKDPAMVAYASDESLDIHRDIAMEVYILTKSEVSKAVRSEAKNKFVFPTLYGSWYKNTGKNLWQAITRSKLTRADGVCLFEHLRQKGISSETQFIEHVKKVEESFNQRFSHWSNAKDEWWDSYLKNGEFPLMTGFVCRGIYSYNNLMNTPIQGPSFHLMLWSLIEVNKWLKKYKFKSRVIGQIHDSLAIDAYVPELQDVLNALDRYMRIEVRKHWDWVVTPLLVEVDVAFTNWFEKKPWVNNNGVWSSKA